jgi:hypothetical protein
MSSCGAKKKNGGDCKGRAMHNGRCRLHGGASLAGIASPTFKSGRYSKYLPLHLLSDFKEAKDDPELVECRDELALIDARLCQLAQRFQSGKDAEMWAVLGMQFDLLATAFDALLSAVEPETEAAESAVREAAGALEGCRSVVGEVRASESTWREVYGVLEQRRKLVETESKRLKDMSQVITAERAMTLILSLAAVVKKHVADPKQLAAISAELIQLTAGESRGEPVAA